MAEPDPATRTPRLSMRGVSKSFGATRALDGVDLDVLPGQVHALIGENGAGKSTLMKVLSGVHRPGQGRMEIDGEPYLPLDTLDARRRGVAMIYQELALAPHLTVAENVLLGVEPSRGGILDRNEANRLTIEALETLGHAEISPAVVVGKLSIGAQQLVEIARALVAKARVIVLDEPTSSLPRPDVERLFEVIANLSRRGVSVVYISHFLEEVERIADAYTVLRDGRSVESGPMAETTIPKLVSAMVGRELDEMFPRVPHEIGEPVLELDRLSAPGVETASLTLRRGEILGVAGLIGAGRTELLRAVFGLSPVRDGSIRVGVVEGPAPPERRLAQGVGLLSEDRKDEGLALSMSLEENLTLSRMKPYARYGWLSRSKLRAAAEEWMEKLSIRAAGPQAPAASLSGGNQQKAQFARLLHHDCDVLLLDEPTRGIDVASKVQIYEWIGRLAASGKAVLFVSSYTPELLGVCDRLAVMYQGRLAPARPTSEWDEHSIMLAAARR